MLFWFQTPLIVIKMNSLLCYPEIHHLETNLLTSPQDLAASQV
jgi:hypothetical protein